MNPFIHLLRNPIQTLTLTGYTLAMLAIALGGIAYTVRMGSTLLVSTSREARRQGNGLYNEWWGGEYGLIPPAGWIRDAWKLAFVGVVMLWALATVVFIATTSL